MAKFSSNETVPLSFPTEVPVKQSATVQPIHLPLHSQPNNAESKPGWEAIQLAKHHDPRGNLSVIQSDLDIPFSINRVYYLYDVPGGASRAGHANRRCHQFLVAMTGSFDVHLKNGEHQESFHLNRSYYGLYIPPMTWRDIDNFSSGAVCMALSSHPYDPDDYYRDYDDYLAAIGHSK